MAVVDREVTSTLHAFRTRGCHVCRDWLTDCINFFRSEHNQYSPKQLEDFVFEQWLLADLRDIAGVGSFPPNLNGTLKTTLDGKMACQVEYVTDIGHSSYSQMQRVRDEDVGNLNVDEAGKEFQQAWEPKSNRMLQLSLNDGKQTIKAIEYRPIPSLKPDLIPGTKILVEGPVLCRRGILMLEERHITLLGGEVEALVISNAYENVLARKLNIPENPDPYNLSRVQAQLPVVPQNDHQTVQHPVRQPAPSANLQQLPQPRPRPHQQAPQQLNIQQGSLQPPCPQPRIQSQLQVSQRNNGRGQSESSRSHSAQQTVNAVKSTNNVPPQNQPLEFCGSDEDFLNIPLNDEWDLEWENETRYVPPHQTSASSSIFQTNNGSSSSMKNDYQMDPDEEALLLEAEACAALNSDSGFEVNSNTSGPTLEGIPSVAGKLAIDKISFKRSASSPHCEESLRIPLFSKRRKETSSEEVSSSTDGNLMVEDVIDLEEASETATKLSINPFVYLSQILQLKNTIPKVYRVKAAVITVIDKLSVSDGNWKLSARISDGSANVDVRFSPTVLETLIGMSPETMSEMKKQMVHQPEKKEILRKKLASAQARLINLNCLLNIQFCEDQDLPTVVGLDELSRDTINALKDRINSVQ